MIAKDLIRRYSRPGDLVADMFCGSGTIPLEAAGLGRRVFASDSSTYAITLTRAKLGAPESVETADELLGGILKKAAALPDPDLRRVPAWVRSFFHPLTLKEILRVVHVLKTDQNDFLLACLLGILHHQRSGFLSHPSSHLIPYLRTRKFPRLKYPSLYEYRPVAPRLRAKIRRALRRQPDFSRSALPVATRLCSTLSLNLPADIDCVVTSPPYMNALDYHRDNRLRLWFLGEHPDPKTDRKLGMHSQYDEMMSALAAQLEAKVRPGGHCVFIAADQTFRGRRASPALAIAKTLGVHAPSLALRDVVTDVIPDIRRSRRRATGVKKEHILVFRRT